MRGETFAPREFDSPLGGAAAGGEVTGRAARLGSTGSSHELESVWVFRSISFGRKRALAGKHRRKAGDLSLLRQVRGALWAGERRPRCGSRSNAISLGLVIS
jgi:hypothetical protein